MRRLAALLACLAATLVASATALAIGSPRVAAVQVALRSKNLYMGSVDGLRGPATTAGLVTLQQQLGLPPNGSLSSRTLSALGPLAGPRLGTRWLGVGMVGGDVVALQFLLAWHGFPNGTIDGAFGLRVEKALRLFQKWAGLPAVGVVGPATVAALRAPVPNCPIVLAWPLSAPMSSTFGPRGAAFHPGIDLAAAPGTPVHAAAVGRVIFAGPTAGGYGKLVIVRHSGAVWTMYAHLSKILVWRGEAVTVGTLVGLVGTTGESTGPHLHFEVRVRDAAVDPLPALSGRGRRPARGR